MADNKHTCQELMSQINPRTGLNHTCSWHLTSLHLLRTGNSFWNTSRFPDPTCKPVQEGLLSPEPNTVLLVEDTSPTDLPKCLNSPVGKSVALKLRETSVKIQISSLTALIHSYLPWNEWTVGFYPVSYTHMRSRGTIQETEDQENPKTAHGFLLCRD